MLKNNTTNLCEALSIMDLMGKKENIIDLTGKK